LLRLSTNIECSHIMDTAFRETQKLKKATSTSVSAGGTSAKVKIPARPRSGAPAAATDNAGADSEVDEALLAELQETEGADEDEEMDVDDAR
jgi:hypothetical protein